jgi:heme/copper-type cytochrome/quinol oxidase subunit 1
MTITESRPETAAVASSDLDAERESDAFARLAASVGSTDHKSIGRLYLGGGLLGLIVTIVVNVLLAVERLDGADTVLDAGALPQIVDAQRIGLVFGTILPLAMALCVAVVPLQLGARAIAFPRLAAAGFWMWFGGLVLVAVSLVNNGGTFGGDSDMVDLFIASLGLMAVGLTATAGTVVTSVLTTRAPGMSMRRVPPFSWSALVFGVGVILVMPVFLGTLTYLFLDHRNARTGFGGNAGITDWVGWLVTQPATYLFAIPAVGVLAEILPVTFKRRTPARGVLFAGLALIGVAAFAGVTQQSVQTLPWVGSTLTDELEQNIRDLVPYVLFNLLPLLGLLIVLIVGLMIARPRRGMDVNVTAGFVLSFFGVGMILVGMLGGVLYAIDDLDLQGTVFEEAVLIYVVYGAVLAVLGAVSYWAPKLWGRTVAAGPAFLLALVGVAGVVLASFPHYVAGFIGQEAGPAYTDDDLTIWNIGVLIGHGLVALTVLGFIGLVLTAARHDRDDPWDAQTLEWATTSPAPRDNFVDLPVVRSAEPLLDLKTVTTTDRSDA